MVQSEMPYTEIADDAETYLNTVLEAVELSK